MHSGPIFIDLAGRKILNQIRKLDLRFAALIITASFISQLDHRQLQAAPISPSTHCILPQDLDDPFGTNELSNEERALQFFDEGQLDRAEKLAAVIESELSDFSTDEKWAVLHLRCLMMQGKYPAALTALKTALKRYENSIQLRWIGAEVLRYNNEANQALAMLVEIEKLWLDDSWRYRSLQDQITLGQFHLWKSVDAKRVLTKFYNPAKTRFVNSPAIYNAIGNLALEKHDYGLAAENFQTAIKISSEDLGAMLGLARAFEPSDTEKQNEWLQKILAINPRHDQALLMVVDNQIAGEEYESAKQNIAKVLETNEHHPEALAFRAAMAHLENKPNEEGSARSAALKHWPGNPRVDYLIGRELSQKYRFKESETYQRRALVYDKDFLPAKMQLAHDLLRLGQELEGWKLADEVFDADQYSVVAHNLVTLREQLSKFKTIERDGFVVRMEKSESEIYGERVLDLLTDASEHLCNKYDVKLQKPVFIEIFPRQQDFAIRTFGLPGGSGFLGVCFGRVITMNSPAAQGASLTSWESVLWHEFCHVVTLQKTKNKMPRWLSEGISVHEELQKDSAWGESMSPGFREMILGDDLTPVSKLSSAFLRPKSGQHLQFAYFESALVVEYLIEKHKLDSLKAILEDLSLGTPINDALRRHAAPLKFLDKDFKEFAIAKTKEFAPKADWTEADLPPNASLEDWTAFNAEHPNHIRGMFAEASLHMQNKNWQPAMDLIQSAIKLTPNGSRTGQTLLARIHREMDQPKKEQAALEELVKLDANSVENYSRLLQLTSETKQWDKTKLYARRLLAVNPLIPKGHQFLADAAQATDDQLATIQSLSVLAKMNPLDAADVNFRLADAYFKSGEIEDAKKAVIVALEQAPRYRDAHRLLLKIIEQEKTKQTNTATTKDPIESESQGSEKTPEEPAEPDKEEEKKKECP